MMILALKHRLRKMANRLRLLFCYIHWRCVYANEKNLIATLTVTKVSANVKIRQTASNIFISFTMLYQCTSCFMTTTSLYKILQYNDKPRCCSSIMVLYSKAHQQTISCKMCTQASQYCYWQMDFCCNV